MLKNYDIELQINAQKYTVVLIELSGILNQIISYTYLQNTTIKNLIKDKMKQK